MADAVSYAHRLADVQLPPAEEEEEYDFITE
jgi:hypothetical protein